MSYITLCACKVDGWNDDLYLFRVPTFTEVKAGTVVFIDDGAGARDATVVSSCTVAEDSKEYETLLALNRFHYKSNEKYPDKIIGYYKYIEYDYSNDEVKDNERSDSKH